MSIQSYINAITNVIIDNYSYKPEPDSKSLENLLTDILNRINDHATQEFVKRYVLVFILGNEKYMRYRIYNKLEIIHKKKLTKLRDIEKILH